MDFKEQFGKNEEEQKEPPPHIPTPEEKEIFETVARLIQDGAEIVRYNEWTREQDYLTEIKEGDEVRSFRTNMPVPMTLGKTRGPEKSE